MQPSFAGDVVILAVDGFIEHVAIVAPEAVYFLLQPNTDLSHQVPIASTAPVVSMSERTWHTPRRRLDDISHHFGIERR